MAQQTWGSVVFDEAGGTVAPSGENHLGETGGKHAAVAVSPVVSTTPAYTAGDNVGGKLTIPGASRLSGKPTKLESIFILDRANQKAALEIIIYNADPSVATLTDNAAFVGGTDDAKEIARISIATSDYVTLNSKARANVRNINEILVPASGTTLYAAIVTTGTPTFAAISDLQMIFKFSQD